MAKIRPLLRIGDEVDGKDFEQNGAWLTHSENETSNGLIAPRKRKKFVIEGLSAALIRQGNLSAHKKAKPCFAFYLNYIP